MTFGFARDDDSIQAQCPNCGRFPNNDDGFYAWIADEPDSISVFCDEQCAHQYQDKGKQLVDGDGEPYRISRS